MIKKNNTKKTYERIHILFHMFLGLFLSPSLSAQIFVKDSSLLYISDQAFIFQLSDIPINKDTIKIFVKENTNITDSQHLIDGKNIYISELPTKSLVKKHKRSKEYKNGKIRKKEIEYKNLFSVKSTNTDDLFLNKSQSLSSAIIFSNSTTKKVAHNPETNLVNSDLNIQNMCAISIWKISIFKLTKYSSFSIRPPPFLFNKTQFQHINFGKEAVKYFFPF